MNKKLQTTLTFKALSIGAILAGGITPALALDACFPTCIANDAKMLSLAGSGLATLSGDSISLSLAAPAGSAGFDLGIFDGDVSGLWDRAPAGAAFSFVLYADPAGDGTGNTVEVGRWSTNDLNPDNTTKVLVNNDWKVLPIINHPAAKSPSGNYFYRLQVINDNPAVVAQNSFKVKVSGGASLGLKPQAFSFIGSLAGRGVLDIVYPQNPSLTPTTYDGNWKFLVKVPAGAKSLTVWDGDLDFGDSNGGNKDTDDPDTPNNVLPAWAAGTAAVFEGIALSSSGVPGIGTPEDDSSEALLRRAPNVNYTLCAPDGVTCYANTNPSGNTEWEQFKIDTVGPFDPTKMDHLAPAIPAGIWSVNLKGVDMSNLNAYRAQYEIIAPPQCPSADPCDLPDPPAPLLPYLIGDTIWLDTNGNGIQDAGEAGIPGVFVQLIDANGLPAGSAITDGEGKYSFPAENGVYTVKVDASNFAAGGALNGYLPTVDYSGDGAGDNERSQSVASANVLTYDFGYTRPASLGDRVWQELQRNGLQDAGEPGMAGVTVTLTGSDGTTKTTQTSSTGNYLFTGLMPGVNYTVRVTAPAGFAFTTPFNWNPANATDNNADSTGNLGTYTLVSGQSLTTVDAGLVQTSCNLSTAQTLTQGGWSNRAHARLLDGLVSQGKIPVRIGNAQNSITLTTRTAVQNFLATGGTPRQLTGGHVTNPTSNIRNTLASQTLTTTLNYLQWSSLGPATLRSGPYAGRSVLEVIYLANQALGSGATSTVYSNLTAALDTINNNLDGGKCNRGNLVCPK